MWLKCRVTVLRLMKSSFANLRVGLPPCQDTKDLHLASRQSVRVLGHVSHLILYRLEQVGRLGSEGPHSKLLGDIESLIEQGKRLVGVWR